MVLQRGLVDYDNDGKLDLFVCQFVEFSKALNKSCGPGEEGKHGYCIPRLYKPASSWLFHNNGDGTFTDVSKASGMAAISGKHGAWLRRTSTMTACSTYSSAMTPLRTSSS